MIKTDLCIISQNQYNFSKYCERIKYYEQRKSQREIEKKQRHNAIVSLCVGFTIGIFLCGFLILKNVNIFQSEPLKQSYTITGELQGNCVVLEDGNVHEVESTYANYTSESINVHCLMDNNGTPENPEDDTIMNIY